MKIYRKIKDKAKIIMTNFVKDKIFTKYRIRKTQSSVSKYLISQIKRNI